MPFQNPCNKKRFATREGAEYGAKEVLKKYKHRMEVYECPNCEFYHLTSKKNKRNAKRKQQQQQQQKGGGK